MKSLFTNAPVKRIHEVLNARWNDTAVHTNLTQSPFMKMIEICTSNSYFQYNNKTYSQKEGCPMGTSISCILVELLMDDVLVRAVNKVKQDLNFDITILKKYVDELYLIIPSDSRQLLLIFCSIMIMRKKNRLQSLPQHLIQRLLHSQNEPSHYLLIHCKID